MTRQCELLAVARSTVYYPRKPAVSEDDLVLMRRLDEVHLQHPFLGSRRLRDALEQEGRFVNRKRIQRLMRMMGLEALYPKRKTSLPGKGHRIFPYLLRGLAIERANHVWCRCASYGTDLTYSPMRQGFCTLIALMDWATRAVLAFRLSTTMEVDFCVEALEEALARYGTPQIFNTDKGRSLPAKRSSAFWSAIKWLSAWRHKAGGGTMCSSNASGTASHTRRRISRPRCARRATTRLLKREPFLPKTSIFTTVTVVIKG